MNLVFMNSLERKAGEDCVLTAQVLIQENQGVWQVLWNEANDEGKQVQDHWFEGGSWDEMLAIFRYRLAEKMAEGYTPLLNGLFESTEGESNRSKLTQMLNYYSEINEEEEMFQKLRKWRSEQSAKEGNAPYLLATNRVLRMISTFLPYSREELLQIPGFGEKKAEIYSQDIIAITQTMKRTHTFPLDWVFEQIDHQLFKQWTFKQKELKYKQELEKQENKKKLLQGIHNGTSCDELVSELQVTRRDLVLSIEQLDQEGYDLDSFLNRELKAVSAEDKKMAWNAFEEKGDRYLKPILQKMYNEEEMKGKNLDSIYEWLRLLRIQFRKNAELEKSKNQAS